MNRDQCLPKRDIKNHPRISNIIQRHSQNKNKRMGNTLNMCTGGEQCFGSSEIPRPLKLKPPPIQEMTKSMSDNGDQVTFADFSDPYVHQSALELGAYIDSSFPPQKLYTPIDQLAEDFPSLAITTDPEPDDFTVDFELSPMISGKFSIPQLLIQSPTFNRQGYQQDECSNIFQLVSDPIDEAVVALRAAIQASNYAFVQSLQRDFKFPISQLKFSDLSTPLHLAVMKSDMLMVQLLLNLGADPGVEDSNRKTPIQLANEMRDYDIVEALLVYEPSVRVSSSALTCSSASESVSRSSPTMHAVPAQRYGLEYQVITLDMRESFVSQITANSLESDSLPTTSIASDINVSVDELIPQDQALRIAIPTKPRGVNRSLRKAASRMLSFIAPSHFPKSRRHQRSTAWRN